MKASSLPRLCVSTCRHRDETPPGVSTSGRPCRQRRGRGYGSALCKERAASRTRRSRGRARAPLERLGFSSEIPSQARSPRHYAVASRLSRRWRSATFGRRLRRENRRCRCVGCQRRHVRVVWSRDLDVCSVDALPLTRELRRIATVPFGRIVTVPRRLPFEATGLCTGASACGLRAALVTAFHWRVALKSAWLPGLSLRDG